jgi:hypothetical protein
MLDLMAIAVLFWIDAVVISPASGVAQSNILIIIGGIFILPFFAIYNDLRARFESLLYNYFEGQASGIMYYRNLFMVSLKVPILVINWFALESVTGSRPDDDDEDEVEKYQKTQ